MLPHRCANVGSWCGCAAPIDENIKAVAASMGAATTSDNEDSDMDKVASVDAVKSTGTPSNSSCFYVSNMTITSTASAWHLKLSHFTPVIAGSWSLWWLVYN